MHRLSVVVSRFSVSTTLHCLNFHEAGERIVATLESHDHESKSELEGHRRDYLTLVGFGLPEQAMALAVRHCGWHCRRSVKKVKASGRLGFSRFNSPLEPDQNKSRSVVLWL